MGNNLYNSTLRSARADTMGYFTKSFDEVFEQKKKRVIHESMNPKNALLRESRDSTNHPNSKPIILGLDLTGSMHKIPLYLIQNGLPHIMDGIIQKGIPDPQILFIGVGDHEYDNYPLQVGQFESGDEELDIWLTRTYPEGGGGSNAGESYHLAWYFASEHTSIDSLEKRNEKGLLFTIGDEPCLPTLPARVVNELMGTSKQISYTMNELLEKVSEKYDVYHLHVMEGSAGKRSLGFWKDLLGQNCIQVDDYTKISDIIVNIVTENTKVSYGNTTIVEPYISKEDIIL